jgi:broad specificity phosphatase PhoE
MAAIYLIRHGQASFGAADYDRLSETGTLQSRVLGAALAPALRRGCVIVCGSMQRHRQTAEACLDAMGRAREWQTDAAWNELDHEAVIRAYRPEYADHSRLRADLTSAADPHHAFQTLFNDAVARWASGAHDADYVESWTGFRARCQHALDTMLARLPASTDALVFTSGGPIASIVQTLMRTPEGDGFKLSWVLANAGITKLIISANGVVLSTLNGHAHFEGEHAKLITYR